MKPGTTDFSAGMSKVHPARTMSPIIPATPEATGVATRDSGRALRVAGVRIGGFHGLFDEFTDMPGRPCQQEQALPVFPGLSSDALMPLLIVEPGFSARVPFRAARTSSPRSMPASYRVSAHSR
jgi:hypothetical protein